MIDLSKLSDDDLKALEASIQAERKSRADRRRQAAIDEIRKLAAEAEIVVSFGNGRTRRTRHPLRTGTTIQHPDDPSKSYTVGKGRPPAWVLRATRESR